MQIRSTVWLVGVLAAVGCGGSKASVDAPPSSTIDAFFSLCGHPGDKGNEYGVGQFCQTLDDCGSNSMATICSNLGNDPSDPSQNSFFCTFECTQTSPAGFCGSGAACQCASAGCGCAPITCGSGI
jgi:hypothetical protein